MSSKRRNHTTGSQPGGTRRAAAPPLSRRGRLYLAILGGGLAIVALAVTALFLLGNSGSGPAPTTGDTIVQGQGGHWTNVTPDRLAKMLQTKDFTLVNVKTPYIGEITGTDTYIPYDQLTARAAELPKDKTARILVYCRSGAESALGAQTLLNLGYTDVWNLDGGMNAWQSSGRALVNLNRT